MKKELLGADAAADASARSASASDAAIARHTAGPWETIASNNSNLIHVETSDTHETVCSLPKKRTANAHLIAAAPEMYEALKGVMAAEHSNAGGGRECCCVAHENARRAIAKAEGR